MRDRLDDCTHTHLIHDSGGKKNRRTVLSSGQSRFSCQLFPMNIKKKGPMHDYKVCVVLHLERTEVRKSRALEYALVRDFSDYDIVESPVRLLAAAAATVQ